MLSIICAVYNQLSMNKLFYEYLKRYTYHEFELIVIDNGSTDGSQKYFSDHGATVIQNDGNYMYPHCQNQGLHIAQFDILVFLNNDILVSKNWDRMALEIMDKYHLEIASCCHTDRLESNKKTKQSQKKWKLIRYPMFFLFGPTRISLKLMHFFFYGNWEKWTQKRFSKFGDSIKEGFSGSNIIMKRSALSKIGLWDERIQGADFDLYLRSKSRNLENGDILPIHLLLGIYMHHYIRLTLRMKYPPFKDADKRIKIEQKWGKNEANKLLEAIGMTL